MFNFISHLFRSTYTKLGSLFQQQTIDKEALNNLERMLIEADTGRITTNVIIDALKKRVGNQPLSGAELRQQLSHELLTLIDVPIDLQSDIILLVGINGSGKTTTAAKLGHYFNKKNKKILLCAADTFRAAATDQLRQWSSNLHIPLIEGTPQQDPASVVFAACQAYRKELYDLLIIDTAGRLHTKTNLMKELEKIKRVIERNLPEKKITTLLVIDALLGQSSLEQARLFHESTKLDGIVLTKMDSASKGGIIFAITHELKIPIAFLSYGEQPDHLVSFNAHDFIQELL